MKNCTMAAPQGGKCVSPGLGAFRTKLPQAKSAVANSTNHGTRRAKTVGGVKSRISAPSAPPIRLMTKSGLIGRPGGLLPVNPVTSCAGNSATVEVMFAARASMPVSISEGRVMNDPPPASAFCAPAQIEATNRIASAVIDEPFASRLPLCEVIENDLAQIEREIGDEMRARDDFAHRQAGDVGERMGMQVERSRTCP